ncbi:hypothetical protein BH09MYX1_BH09MYX1_33960 [soil metagenome]
MWKSKLGAVIALALFGGMAACSTEKPPEDPANAVMPARLPQKLGAFAPTSHDVLR